MAVLLPHCDSRHACKCKLNILTDMLRTYCLLPTLLLRKGCTLYHSSIICLRSLQTHQFDPTSQCQDKPRNKLKGFNHCFSLVKRVCSYKREAQECSTLRLPQLSGKYDQPSKCWNPCQRTNMTQEARELMLPTILNTSRAKASI